MMRIVLLGLTLMLVACGSGIDESSENDVPDVDQPSSAEDTGADQSDEASDGRSNNETDLSGVVQAAASDLAGRLGMGAADIQLFSAETVTWRDGSLGCPDEGGVYTQALVQDGYRIILVANGETYHYHGAGSREPFLCRTPQEPYTGGATGS